MSTGFETCRSEMQSPTADIQGRKRQAYPPSIESGKMRTDEENPENYSEELQKNDWINHPPFRWGVSVKGENREKDEKFVNKYVLECFCKRVQFTLSTDPLDVKICHCDVCKKLHGAPMQAAAVFHKTDARLTKGFVGDIAFFSSSLPNPHISFHATPSPRKLYCTGCGCPLADEGKNMFIAYPSSIRPWKREMDGAEKQSADPLEEEMDKLPEAFNVRKHIFYSKRALDMPDGLPKWEGLDGKSRRMDDDGNFVEEGKDPSKESFQ